MLWPPHGNHCFASLSTLLITNATRRNFERQIHTVERESQIMFPRCDRSLFLTDEREVFTSDN